MRLVFLLGLLGNLCRLQEIREQDVARETSEADATVTVGIRFDRRIQPRGRMFRCSPPAEVAWIAEDPVDPA